MNLTDERGNAIVEFVAIGLLAQLLIFGSMIKIGTTFRSEIAAQVIARQSLRTIQLSGSVAEANRMANQVLGIFGIPTVDAKLSIANTCSTSGLYSVTVRVRGASYESSGFCLG